MPPLAGLLPLALLEQLRVAGFKTGKGSHVVFLLRRRLLNSLCSSRKWKMCSVKTTSHWRTVAASHLKKLGSFNDRFG